MTKPSGGMTKHVAKQLAWFQRTAELFRLILADHRDAGMGFELAWERAMGSLNKEERRRWRDLFLESKDEWEQAFNREGIEPEPDIELLQISYALL